MNELDFERDGFCLLPHAVSIKAIKHLLRGFGETFSSDSEGVRARTSGPSVEGTRRHRRILHLEFAADETFPDGVMWHDFISADTESVSF